MSTNTGGRPPELFSGLGYGEKKHSKPGIFFTIMIVIGLIGGVYLMWGKKAAPEQPAASATIP